MKREMLKKVRNQSHKRIRELYHPKNVACPITRKVGLMTIKSVMIHTANEHLKSIFRSLAFQ